MLALPVLLSLSGSSPENIENKLTPELKSIVDGNSAFAFDLYSRLKTNTGNFLVSPFSISSALGLTYGGARNTTAAQMAQALHFPTNVPFHVGMSAVLDACNRPKGSGIELRIANGLWSQRGYSLKDEFMRLARTNYHCDPAILDFTDDSRAAGRHLSEWVARQTSGKIKESFQSGDLNSETRLVIVNAIYFKGNWSSRFDKAKTHRGQFWDAAGQPTTVPMMNQKVLFPFLAADNFQILELPYLGQTVSMLLILPNKRDGLPQVEQDLTVENLNHWIQRLAEAEVDVQLPKFSLNSQFRLNQLLTTMGMRDAFDVSRADFSGITAGRPFFLSAVEHAAIMEVDEEGTVAAATTHVSFGCAKAPARATFHADHPFVFLIRDNQTGTILFIGRVTDPNTLKNPE